MQLPATFIANTGAEGPIMKTFLLHETTTPHFCKLCSSRIWHLPSMIKYLQPLPVSHRNSHSILKEKDPKVLTILCQSLFVAFSHIHQKTSLSVALPLPKIAFSAFSWEGSHRAALSWVMKRLSIPSFSSQTSIFISEKETSTGGKRGLRTHSSHLQWHLSGVHFALVQLLLSQGAGRAPALCPWLTQTLLCCNFRCKSWQTQYDPWKLINQQRFSACLCWVQIEREEI